MTVRQTWAQGVQVLRQAPVVTQTPELDARVLLCSVLRTDLTGLLGHYPEPFPQQAEAEWHALLERRGQGVPVAWLVGKQEFMGLDFAVGEGVLVPRADTETLVNAALELLPTLAPRVDVLDVCTGSGCVAIAVAAFAAEAPVPEPLKLTVSATDVSPQALKFARSNAAALLPGGPNITFHQADLLDGVEGRWNLIVSNPPYLTPLETVERVEQLGWKEPPLALDGGGDDGLNLIRRLILQANSHLAPGGWVLLEAADAQMRALRRLLTDSGFSELRTWFDLGGQQRVMGGRKN